MLTINVSSRCRRCCSKFHLFHSIQRMLYVTWDIFLHVPHIIPFVCLSVCLQAITFLYFMRFPVKIVTMHNMALGSGSANSPPSTSSQGGGTSQAFMSPTSSRSPMHSLDKSPPPPGVLRSVSDCSDFDEALRTNSNGIFVTFVYQDGDHF